MEHVLSQLDRARSEEWWLCSGWTLQEGVLLSETNLIDGEGNALPGLYFWLGDQATVSDLTIPISRLAYELAMAYFIRSQGHEPDMGAEVPVAVHVMSRAPELWLRRSLQTFLRSGLVNFWKRSPLYILSGKQGRSFGNIRDSCWALVGALDITDIEVSYDESVSMEEVKTRLLRALVDKYQWEILMLAFPESLGRKEDDQDGPAGRGFRWTDVVDGVMLPIDAFCVEVQDGPEASQGSLPILSYTNGLHIKGRKDNRICLFRPSAGSASWFRHYRQDGDGLKCVSNKEVAFGQDRILSTAWLLPIHHINMKVDNPGRRCLVLLGLTQQTARAPATATFGGMIDIESVEGETMEVGGVISLNPSLRGPGNSLMMLAKHFD